MAGVRDHEFEALAKTLTEDALVLRLKSNEHDFVERKPKGQRGDWLQSAVAFANSAPIGWPAVLFVGVDDRGVPQCQTTNELGVLIQSVTDTLERAYPAIYRLIVPLNIQGEGCCLAVVVPGSPMRPHFAGQAYIRLGDQTRIASDTQFDSLVAARTSKAWEILKWIGKEVSVSNVFHSSATVGYGEIPVQGRFVVASCNVHFVTLREMAASDMETLKSYRLGSLELGFDHPHNRLLIYRYLDR